MKKEELESIKSKGFWPLDKKMLLKLLYFVFFLGMPSCVFFYIASLGYERGQSDILVMGLISGVVFSLLLLHLIFGFYQWHRFYSIETKDVSRNSLYEMMEGLGFTNLKYNERGYANCYAKETGSALGGHLTFVVDEYRLLVNGRKSYDLNWVGQIALPSGYSGTRKIEEQIKTVANTRS